MDPLLLLLQEDAAHELAAAATNLAVTVELLSAAHAVAAGSGDPGAAELLAAIDAMTAVRDSLHGHAATLSNAGRFGTVAVRGASG
ncbi:hypothetical protein [Actinoplanes sp. URMC 104]|uniref:hypothetical protein n=1 Tax=Actinoplanes sp. URMC 104 TaxID=3423409 RepID=UPI003F1E2599